MSNGRQIPPERNYQDTSQLATMQKYVMMIVMIVSVHNDSMICRLPINQTLLPRFCEVLVEDTKQPTTVIAGDGTVAPGTMCTVSQFSHITSVASSICSVDTFQTNLQQVGHPPPQTIKKNLKKIYDKGGILKTDVSSRKTHMKLRLKFRVVKLSME